MINIRKIALGIASASFLFATGLAQAQGYPQKGTTIRIIVPFSAGSGTDVMTRTLIEDVQKSLSGVTVVIDNKAGANGAIASEIVSKAAPDGNTLLLVTSSAFSANPWLMKKLSYDPVKDFTPIVRVVDFPFMLVVSGTSPIKTLDDLVKHIQSGAKMAMGYGNATGQVANAHLMKAAKFEGVSVPYKSTPPAMTDLIGGQFDAMFVDMASSQGLVKDGRIRPLAVMADRRSKLMPNLPALGEKFPGFTYVAWGGLVGPAGLPAEVVTKMQATFSSSLANPSVVKRFGELGLEPYPSTTAEFANFILEQKGAWGAKIKDAGIQPE